MIINYIFFYIYNNIILCRELNYFMNKSNKYWNFHNDFDLVITPSLYFENEDNEYEDLYIY